MKKKINNKKFIKKNLEDFFFRVFLQKQSSKGALVAPISQLHPCKKTNMTILKNYKLEKIINEMFENNQHGGNFYEAMDHWNHHKGQFTKVV